MLAIIKIIVTLAIIVYLINRKFSMGTAMLAGSTVLFVLTEPSVEKLSGAALTTALGYSTWEIIVALYFVMCLEYQLRTGGIIDGLMHSARQLLKSDRVLLALMPSFLGFLPSLGGAIFSAPLVENASKSYDVTQEAKTTINYWFRHVWEYTNPMFTGMLLASQLSGISLGTLVSNMAWVTLLAIVIGWIFLIAPLKSIAAGPLTEHDRKNTSGAAGESINWRVIGLGLGPVLANLFLLVVLKLSASVSMALVVVLMIFILRQHATDVRAMLSHAFDKKLLLGVVGILFFQNVLRLSGAIGDAAQLLNHAEIPPSVIVGIIAFTGGLLTGTSQGFVALAFPFIGVLSPGDLSLILVCFVMGTAGHMLSPAHLCLIVTLDYFNSNFARTLRPVLALQAILAIVTYGFISFKG